MTTYYPMEFQSSTSSILHQSSPPYSHPHYVPAQYPMTDVMIPPMQRFTSLSSLPDPDIPSLPMVPSSPSFSIASTSSHIPSWPNPPMASPIASNGPLSSSSTTSPFLPQSLYQSQLYSHRHFSVEIPFANDRQAELSRSMGSGESDGDGVGMSMPPPSYSSYSTTSGEGSVESQGDPSPKGKKRRAKSSASPQGNKRKTSSPLPSPPPLHEQSSSPSPTPLSQSQSHLSPSELKKVRHREIDAARRAREGAAISRLHSLIAGPSAVASAPGGGDEKVTDKKDKVGILEVVGDRLMELERLCERLKGEVMEKEEKLSDATESVSKMSKQMKALLTNSAAASSAMVHSAAADKLASLDPNVQLSAPARAYLQQLETSASLYSLSFVHSSLILLILSVQTGKCVDANQKFCDVAGWTKDEVIGRPFCQTANELFNDSPTNDDVTCTFAGGAGAEAAVKGGQIDAGLLGRHSRYACNKAELIALYTGKKSSITVVFRVALAKGQVIDVRCRCWLGNGEVEEGIEGVDGGQRTASHVIVQTTEEDIIVLS